MFNELNEKSYFTFFTFSFLPVCFPFVATRGWTSRVHHIVLLGECVPSIDFIFIPENVDLSIVIKRNYNRGLNTVVVVFHFNV